MRKLVFFLNDSAVCINVKPILERYGSIFEFEILCLSGSVVEKILDNFKLNFIDESLEKLPDCDIFFTGTSWQNDLHLKLIKIAKKQGVKSVALMEHWVNYESRFLKNNELVMPDFFLINDEFAYEIAKNLGLKNVLKLEFLKLKNDILRYKSLRVKEKNAVLFISEPTSDVALKSYNDANFWGFSEFDVVENIALNLSFFNAKHLTIRPHPSDKLDKYNYMKKKFPNLFIKIENPYKNDIIKSIKKHKFIIGIDGFALYLALVLGKNSISFMPSEKRKCVVPEITKVRKISEISYKKPKNLQKQTKKFGLSFKKIVDLVQKQRS